MFRNYNIKKEIEKCEICEKNKIICRYKCDQHKTNHGFCKNCLIANFQIMAEIFTMNRYGMSSIIDSNKCCYGVDILNEENKNVLVFYPITGKYKIRC